MRRTILCLFSAALLGGCSQRTMTVTSEPDGALVFMNGQEVGRTPFTRDFTWYGRYDVQLRKDGYDTLHAKPMLVAPIWEWPPFDLLAELWPGHLHDRRKLNFVMKPTTMQAEDSASMIAGAAEMKKLLQSSEYTKKPATAPVEKPTTAK